MHIQGEGEDGDAGGSAPYEYQGAFLGIPLRKRGTGSQDTRRGCVTARTPCSPVYSINQDMI